MLSQQENRTPNPPGAVHSGVPAWLLVLSMVLRRARDNPKSHT